jgi:hypothetical protein
MTEPAMDWQPRHVTITADGPTARVVLDAADISRHVRGYTVEQRTGERPVIVLYAHPDAGTVFDGMAQVAVAGQPDEQDQGAVIAAFLANINPASLEDAALNRDDLDDERHCMARAMLAQLADWAQGKAGA